MPLSSLDFIQIGFFYFTMREADLIDAYVRGELPPDWLPGFERRFLRSQAGAVRWNSQTKLWRGLSWSRKAHLDDAQLLAAAQAVFPASHCFASTNSSS